jgi:lysophospholipid acyltransferase (LPLAT)-like uncharacterized protein
MGSLDFRAAYFDRSADPALDEFRGPVVFCIWHEYCPVPFYLRPYSKLSILTSRHADAEALAQAAGFVGFESVRGSTARGGVAALRGLFAEGKRRNLAIAPDGPRGPRRHFAAGPVYIAARLGIPLVLIVPGYDRPWRLKTWDRFAIPRPGSRCRIIMSPRIEIPRDLDRQGIEQYRGYVERLYVALTEHAEAWAEGRINIEPQFSTRLVACTSCRIEDLRDGVDDRFEGLRAA